MSIVALRGVFCDSASQPFETEDSGLGLFCLWQKLWVFSLLSCVDLILELKRSLANLGYL